MAKTPQILTQRARSLRSDLTDAERRLWRRIRDRQIGGWRFRRQHPIESYVADFACLDARLVVEVDGGQHAESRRGEVRDQRLQSLGWRVLRFWNNGVLANMEGVVATILAALGPHPGPPPAEPREGV